MAAEIAYFTYMYAKVARDKYQQVTGNARAALLTGRFLASILGQTLVSFEVMDLRQLNYITLGGERNVINTLSFITSEKHSHQFRIFHTIVFRYLGLSTQHSKVAQNTRKKTQNQT
jgi:Reduced folate carrier